VVIKCLGGRLQGKGEKGGLGENWETSDQVKQGRTIWNFTDI